MWKTAGEKGEEAAAKVAARILSLEKESLEEEYLCITQIPLRPLSPVFEGERESAQSGSRMYCTTLVNSDTRCRR